MQSLPILIQGFQPSNYLDHGLCPDIRSKRIVISLCGPARPLLSATIGHISAATSRDKLQYDPTTVLEITMYSFAEEKEGDLMRKHAPYSI